MTTDGRRYGAERSGPFCAQIAVKVSRRPKENADYCAPVVGTTPSEVFDLSTLDYVSDERSSSSCFTPMKVRIDFEASLAATPSTPCRR